MTDHERALQMIARCFAHQHPEEFNRGSIAAETLPENTPVDEPVGEPDDPLARAYFPETG